MKLKQNGVSGNMLKILSYFLAIRYQRIVFSCQIFRWTVVNVGLLQGSVSEPVLIYINELLTGLSMSPKVFANVTYGFFDNDMTPSANDLIKFSNGIYQWKMGFNPDPSKLLSCKLHAVSFIYLFILLFIYLFIYLFIHSFIFYLFIYLIIYLFLCIYLFIYFVKLRNQTT